MTRMLAVIGFLIMYSPLASSAFDLTLDLKSSRTEYRRNFGSRTIKLPKKFLCKTFDLELLSVSGSQIRIKTVINTATPENAKFLLKSGHVGWYQAELRTATVNQVSFELHAKEALPSKKLLSFEWFARGNKKDSDVDFATNDLYGSYYTGPKYLRVFNQKPFFGSNFFSEPSPPEHTDAECETVY